MTNNCRKYKSTSKFSWRARIHSFRYAVKGIKTLIVDEHNARIHLAAAISAVAFGIWLHITSMEWCVVVLCIAIVISMEALNSAVEALADRIDTQKNPLIGKAKDTAAAAVLISAIGAAAAGLIIFVPRLCTKIGLIM